MCIKMRTKLAQWKAVLADRMPAWVALGDATLSYVASDKEVFTGHQRQVCVEGQVEGRACS